MRKVLPIITAIFLTAFAVFAQTPDIGITSGLALGEVTAMDAAAKKISLKTKDGAIEVILSNTTIYKRMSPDKPTDLKAAVASTLAEIGVGDRVIAVGPVAADKKSVPAKQVILMTKSDLAKKQQADAEVWRSGITGKVVSISLATKEVTVAARTAAGEKNIIINDTSKVVFRRYAPDSVKYSDTKISNLGELFVGDQVRARGAKSADEARFTADEIVSGSFKMVGGTITAIDAAKGEIVINDIQTKKPVTILVNQNTLIRKFPAEMAQMMARMQMMRAAGGQMPQGGQPTNGQNPNATGGQNPQRPTTQGGQNPTGTPSANGGMMRGPGAGRGEVDDMLERLPAVTLAELKIGDAIATSSTTGKDLSRVTAIKLVAGVEAFFAVPAMPAGNGQRQTSSPSFNIPGLDSIGGF